MKPYVVMHMGISIDGRIVPNTWPKAAKSELSEIYEDIHQKLKGDAWIVGRVTMAEFGKGEPRPTRAEEVYPRSTWKAPNASKGPYGVALDQAGKLHLNVNTANNDPIVAVLTEAVSDDHLAELRRDGISYVFAGATELDLGMVLEQLNAEFGIERLLLEGGGGINGSFLESGLIDEVSLLIAPIADGSEGPTLLTKGAPAAVLLKLDSVEQMQGDFLYVRYRVTAKH